MSAKRSIVHFLAYAIGALLVWALVGCGGGGGGGVGGGNVALKIAWPNVAPRYIPPYAQSLSFSLYSLDRNQTLNLVVNRPDTLPLVQTVEFTGPIIAGHYILQGVAKVGFNGMGATVAKNTAPVTVLATGTTTVALTLNSTLYSIDLLDMPLSMKVGDGKQLVVQVFDKDMNQVFLPDGALTWSLLFGADSVSLSDAGFVTATAPGDARVRVSEVGAGLYSEGDVSVAAVSPAFRSARLNPAKPLKMVKASARATFGKR